MLIIDLRARFDPHHRPSQDVENKFMQPTSGSSSNFTLSHRSERG